MSSILITGGAGFIGSHLAERLLESGEKVVVFDDLNNSYSRKIKRDNISKVFDLPNYTFVEGDIRDQDAFEVLFESHKIKKVVHLAARAGVRASLKSPLSYEDVNVGGTITVLETCRKVGIENLLVASSSSVYGNSDKVPFQETDTADKPISPYAATKRSVELICHAYHHLFSIPITCFRFFTVYGPRQRPDMGFHTFARQMISNQSIRMFGDGSTQRDYTYISDIVDGLVAALKYPNSFEIVNFGNSRTVKLSYALEIIQNVLKCKAVIDQYPEQPGDVCLTYADISKAKRLYNFTPEVDIEEGIESFARWFLEKRRQQIL